MRTRLIVSCLKYCFDSNSEKFIALRIRKRHQNTHYSDNAILFSCLVFIVAKLEEYTRLLQKLRGGKSKLLK